MQDALVPCFYESIWDIMEGCTFWFRATECSNCVEGLGGLGYVVVNGYRVRRSVPQVLRRIQKALIVELC